MKVICAWCQLDMGEKEPLEVTLTSHGICEKCSEEMLTQTGRYASGQSNLAVNQTANAFGGSNPSRPTSGDKI